MESAPDHLGCDFRRFKDSPKGMGNEPGRLEEYGRADGVVETEAYGKCTFSWEEVG